MNVAQHKQWKPESTMEMEIQWWRRSKRETLEINPEKIKDKKRNFYMQRFKGFDNNANLRGFGSGFG